MRSRCFKPTVYRILLTPRPRASQNQRQPSDKQGGAHKTSARPMIADVQAAKRRRSCACFEIADDREREPFHSFPECGWLVTGNLVVGVWPDSSWRSSAAQQVPPVSPAFVADDTLFPHEGLAVTCPTFSQDFKSGAR